MSQEMIEARKKEIGNCGSIRLNSFDRDGICMYCGHAKASHVVAGDSWACVACPVSDSFFHGLVERTTRIITMRNISIFTVKTLRKALGITSSDRSGIIFLTRVVKFLLAKGLITIVKKDNNIKHAKIYKVINT